MSECKLQSQDAATTAELNRMYKGVRVHREGGAPDSLGKTCLGVAVVILVVIILIVAIGGRGKTERFYTQYATEQPTREWPPYTGQIGWGTWGVIPWALRASPHDRPDYMDESRGLP